MGVKIDNSKFPFVKNFKNKDGGDVDTVNWAVIQGKPATFPPSSHEHNTIDILEDISDI